MHDFIAGELRIDVFEAEPPAPARLFWSGRSVSPDPDRLLQPFYESVLASAERTKSTVEMHFERLGHFSSSTVATLIRLIQEARKRGIKLVLVYKDSQRTQRLSFDALRIFVKDDGLLELRAR